jgi:hypothetical protein
MCLVRGVGVVLRKNQREKSPKSKIFNNMFKKETKHNDSMKPEIVTPSPKTTSLFFK